jgi:hypothetical protein
VLKEPLENSWGLHLLFFEVIVPSERVGAVEKTSPCSAEVHFQISALAMLEAMG